jgi:hypothetical protein
MIILGLHAYHGDISAVVLRNGELVAAVEEESAVCAIEGFSDFVSTSSTVHRSAAAPLTYPLPGAVSTHTAAPQAIPQRLPDQASGLPPSTTSTCLASRQPPR